MTLIRPKCKKCYTLMKAGTALQDTWRTHHARSEHGSHDTVINDGPPVMIPVWKCPQCGHSIAR